MIIPRALCPSCNQQIPTRDGRLIRHGGRRLRWAGYRWLRVTCEGSGQQVEETRSEA